MQARDVIAALALCGAIAIATYFASTRFGEADQNAAIAAAIGSNIVDWWGIDVSPDNEIGLGQASVCIESEVPLDIDHIDERFAGTIVRLVPHSACSSRTVEGDFGMFLAMTYYYDDEGVEAAHLSIPRVECRTSSECILDVDTHGAGNSFRVQRVADEWEVVEQWNRWIV